DAGKGRSASRMSSALTTIDVLTLALASVLRHSRPEAASARKLRLLPQGGENAKVTVIAVRELDHHQRRRASQRERGAITSGTIKGWYPSHHRRNGGWPGAARQAGAI